MKLTAKCLRFYNDVHQELSEIGRAVADSFKAHLYCESFEILHDRIHFNLWQSGVRGGSNDPWTSIEIPFETLLLDNRIAVIKAQVEAKYRAERELENKVRREYQEREERATLERLRQKYDAIS